MFGNIIGLVIFLAAAGGFGYLIYMRRKVKAEKEAASPSSMSLEELRKRYKKPEIVPAPAPAPAPEPAPVEPPKEGA